jgi:sulfotransferase family protein
MYEPGALPNLIVIGAMKAGTTALHRLLGCHPDVFMSEPKELNFFFEDEVRPRSHGSRTGTSAREWTAGNRHRGLAWYARHFDGSKRVRGESSPGYTSPDHAGVAEAIATTIPDARLIYAVRDPVDRAVSQYRHHVREGTERRPPEEALSDERSHYIARSLYHRRLSPFLSHFTSDRITVVAQEDLLRRPHETLHAIFSVLGVNPRGVSLDKATRPRPSGQALEGITDELRIRLARRFVSDVHLLERFAGRRFDWPSLAL